jgi:hypothetical protein
MTTNYAAVIYRSTDGGSTWTDVYTIPDYPQNPYSPTVLSSNIDGSIIYAAFNNTDQKIYKSLDNGATWNVIGTLGSVPGPFSGISSNATGDFLFASDGNGNVNVFYETHSAESVLVPANGSLFRTLTTYNNGLNMIVMKNNAAETYVVHNLFPPGPYPGQPVTCFKEDSLILCFIDNQETYVKIQDIRKGTLVKTSLNGYVPVHMIGVSKMYNPAHNLRGKDRLYVCKPSAYSEVFQDLIITGCHSILLRHITDAHREKTIEMLGRIMVTDKKYRLMACIDERAEPYQEEGVHTIYHISLDHEDERMNYGVYANGLLVETCSRRFLRDLSGMEIIE